MDDFFEQRVMEYKAMHYNEIRFITESEDLADALEDHASKTSTLIITYDDITPDELRQLGGMSSVTTVVAHIDTDLSPLLTNPACRVLHLFARANAGTVTALAGETSHVVSFHENRRFDEPCPEFVAYIKANKLYSLRLSGPLSDDIHEALTNATRIQELRLEGAKGIDWTRIPAHVDMLTANELSVGFWKYIQSAKVTRLHLTYLYDDQAPLENLKRLGVMLRELHVLIEISQRSLRALLAPGSQIRDLSLMLDTKSAEGLRYGLTRRQNCLRVLEIRYGSDFAPLVDAFRHPHCNLSQLVVPNYPHVNEDFIAAKNATLRYAISNMMTPFHVPDEILEIIVSFTNPRLRTPHHSLWHLLPCWGYRYAV